MKGFVSLGWAVTVILKLWGGPYWWHIESLQVIKLNIIFEGGGEKNKNDAIVLNSISPKFNLDYFFITNDWRKMRCGM